jgi:hypothetical protein
MANYPRTYLSKSDGRYTVIHNGMPICDYKATREEALRAATQMRVKASDSLYWHGDSGKFLPSLT